jgi:hypothetical protein
MYIALLILCIAGIFGLALFANKAYQQRNFLLNLLAVALLFVWIVGWYMAAAFYANSL